MLKIALLSGVSLLAMTSHAFALEAVGSLVISALLAVPGGASLLPVASAAVIGQQVVGAAIVAANIAMSFTRRTPTINPGEYKNTFEETGNQSEIRAIGRVRTGGLRIFGNTNGLNRYRLIAHTKGRWTATEEHWLGGREVVVDDNGAVSSPPYARPGGSWVHLFQKPGVGGEASWSALMAEFPDLWTAEHRVRGIFQTLIRYVSPGMDTASEIKKFQLLYQQGEPPYEAVGRAEPVYDPRDPSQSPTSPVTWQWRDNGILCAAHILCSFPGWSPDDLDYDDIAIEATKADALMPSRDGNIPTARAWGFWPSEAERSSIMEQVLRSIGAEIVPKGNKYTIRLITDNPVAEVEFDERHIINIEWRSGPESVERPNHCRVKYYSPERNYEMADITMTGQWHLAQGEIDRVGDQYYDVDLPFCPSSGQAQRIARRLFFMARADTGTITLNMAGLAAWGKSYASIFFPDLDEHKLCAIGTPRVDDASGTVSIPFIVWPDLPAWQVGPMESWPPEPIPDLQFPSELPTPNRPAEVAQIAYPGGAREVRIMFAGVTGGTIAEATSRTYAGGFAEPWATMNEYKGQTSRWYAYRTGNYQGQPMDFRSRFFDDDGNGSSWSPITEARPVVMDNTPCAAPTVVLTPQTFDGENFIPAKLTITVSELRASYVQVSIRSINTNPPPPFVYNPVANINVRPEIAVEYVFPIYPTSSEVHFGVRTMTSNSTAGTMYTGSFVT